MLRRNLFLLATVQLIFAGVASADPTYTYVTDATSYPVVAGSAVQVHVYLKESLTAGETSLIASQQGLFAGGFAVTLAPGQSNPATLTAIRGDSTTFDGGFTADPLNTSTRLRGDNLVGPTDTSGPSPTGGLISLGFVTVQSSLAGTNTQFRLGAYQPGAGGFTQTFALPGDDLDLTNNDGVGPDTYTGAGGTTASPIPFNELFTVSTIAAVVPEPASIGLLSITGLLLAARRRGTGT